MNAGQRLNDIFTSAMNVPKATELSTAAMWAQVFDLKLSADVQRQVAPCLMALNNEIDAVRAALVARKANQLMLEPAFKRMKQAAEFSRLGSPWKDFHGNIITPEVRCALAWVAWAMPEEEDPIAVEALKAMLADIEALEEHATVEGVSPFIRELALQTANSLRAGLTIYGVQGIAALGDAMQKIAGSVVLQDAHIEAEAKNATPQTRKVLERMKAAMERVAKTADAADKWHKRLESIASIYDKAAALIDKYLPLLTGPGRDS